MARLGRYFLPDRIRVGVESRIRIGVELLATLVTCSLRGSPEREGRRRKDRV